MFFYNLIIFLGSHSELITQQVVVVAVGAATAAVLHCGPEKLCDNFDNNCRISWSINV